VRPSEGEESGVGRAKDGDEVILEGANGSFGCIATMVVWGNELKVHIGQFQMSFHVVGSFIVQALEFGAETTVDELLGKISVSSEQFRACAVFERCHQDGIGIVGVDNHDISVATIRDDRKGSSLVGGDQSSAGNDSCINEVGVGRREIDWRRLWTRGLDCGGDNVLGGSHILPLLVHMSFEHGSRRR